VLAPPIRNSGFDDGGEGDRFLRVGLEAEGFSLRAPFPKEGDWMDNAGSAH